MDQTTHKIGVCHVGHNGGDGDGGDCDWEGFAPSQVSWRSWTLPDLDPTVRVVRKAAVLIDEPARMDAESQLQVAVADAEHRTPLDREKPDGPFDPLKVWRLSWVVAAVTAPRSAWTLPPPCRGICR